MGTTIRRQPVSFPIPASPDYRFLNITDFGGLNVSSNPFVVSSNTASDCLNVYVDEDNALSTRPRLQAKYDLMDLAGLDDSYDLIDVYNLHDGYLLHAKKDDKGYMYRFEEASGVLKSPSPIAGEKPVNKCRVFEQNGNVYVLTGKGYKNIIKNEISDVIGYIPTTTIGKTDSVAGETYEALNLLSDKFKETYFWDGTWSTDSLLQFPDDELVNNYSKNETLKITDSQGNEINGDIIQPIRGLYDNEDGKKYFLCYIEDQFERYNSYYVVAAVDVFNHLIEHETYGIPFSEMPEYREDVKQRMVCSENGLTVAFVSWNDSLNQPRLGYYCTRPSILSEFTFSSSGFGPYDETENWFKPSTTTGKHFTISPDGKLITHRKTDTRVQYIYIDDLSDGSKTYERYIDDITDYDIEMLNKNDDKYFFAAGTRDAENFNIVDHLKAGFLTRKIAGDNTAYLDVTLTSQNKKPWADSEKCVDLTLKAIPETFSYMASMKITTEKDSFVYSAIWKLGAESQYYDIEISKSTLKENRSNLIFANDLTTGYSYFKNKHENFSGRFNTDTGKAVSSGLNIIVDLSTAYVSKNVLIGVTNKVSTILEYTKQTILFESKEPLLTLVRNVSNLDEKEFDEYFKMRDSMQTAILYERFDNNTWFASKNYTFHTLYNDPTYIPLSSYNDLGEDFEEITGLSIVNDNVLAAYKRNRIYIITPVTIGNEETYSYTETKNVVGNDVLDAPILTILTEMPTIVSYDGIFALNQLENVQSSDRITTLISENINPRWLKESSEDIDNCKTLNRLYWTYYILPHRRTGDENKDYTKIYLLDNRTQQWYYWELPIYVINAMVKDNKTHFVHETGTIFTLEITDLIHEFNPDVTEYYDKVNDEKLIIPWYWTSQILSLSTINYSKKLVDTTFILTDTDTQDEYGLDYSFKAWRKSVSETNATTISNNIHYVQSTTKRTMIPRFNFIQIKLSNTAEDLDNNKLRLVGLGLKYVLLEGLY